MLKKLNNKKIVIITLCIMVLLLVIGTSVALWTRAFTQTGVNTNTTDCFNVTFSEGNSVSQTNLYPQTDEQGLTNNPYQVTITNTCNTAASYNVVLHKDNTSTLANSHIKVALDTNVKLLSNLTSKTSSIDSTTYTAYDVGTGVVAGNDTKTVSIRSWMDQDTSQTDGENKTFNYKITIEATPSSDRLADVILLSNTLYTTTPNFDEADPVKLAEEQISENRPIKLTSTVSGDKVIGTGYVFNPRSGWYTLTGTSENQTYDSNSIGKYTCDNSKSKCEYMYKIKEVEQVDESTNRVIKEDYYLRISTDEIYSQSGLYQTPDDQGTSYYFRGKVDNNYVSFANQLWRVMRINGDGSIRLILDGDTGTASQFNSARDNKKYVGYTYDNESACTKANPCISDFNASTQTFTNNKTVTNSTIKTYLENTWYKTNLAAYNDRIVLANYCNDTSIYSVSDDYTYFGTYGRIAEQGAASLICPDTEQNYGGFYQSKIGLVSGDEATMAGLVYAQGNIYRNLPEKTNYLYHSKSWLFGSPSNYYSGYAVVLLEQYANARITNIGNVTSSRAVRPVINLKSDITVVSGDGSHDHPYVVE